MEAGDGARAISNWGNREAVRCFLPGLLSTPCPNLQRALQKPGKAGKKQSLSVIEKKWKARNGHFALETWAS